jgi:hydroxymethylbilane synthase
MSPPVPLRLGTRRSSLALAQSNMVAEAVTSLTGLPVELVEITTDGDVSREALAQIGGTGVFVSALREALLADRIDFAVHSLKDLPTAAPDGLMLAAVPVREDPSDVLVARGQRTLAGLPAQARVGTGSPRRMAQLRMLRPDLEVLAIRGNVDTRIGYVAGRQLDAVVLARAGLARLGRLDVVTEVLEPARMLPAPGQGALAIECRAATDAASVELAVLLAGLDDPVSRAAVTAERAVLAALEAGCSAPVGAYAEVSGGCRDGSGRCRDEENAVLRLSAVAVRADGSGNVRLSATGPMSEADVLGRRLAADMLAHGAAVGAAVGSRGPAVI